MNSSAYARLQDAFVRIVTPLRREFGISVDVPRLRTDREYARWVVEMALTGQQPVLKEAAELIAFYLRAADARDAALKPLLADTSSAESFAPQAGDR